MTPPAIDLSVVVASISRPALVSGCLAALADSMEMLDPECGRQVVLVRAADQADLDVLPEYDSLGASPVECVDAENGADVFRLRCLGASAAVGRLVALIEDHVVVAPGWAAELVRAHRDGAEAIGGPVAPAPGVDFALYASEYGWHAPPGEAGPVPAVSGVNVAYDREVLEAHRKLWHSELREDEINDALRATGGVLRFEPRAAVASRLEMSRAEAAAHLYEGGRHYGRRRAESAVGMRRWAHLLRAPLVPGVLGLRLARRLLPAPSGCRVRFLRHLPGIGRLLAAWGLGELAGTLDALRGRRCA